MEAGSPLGDLAAAVRQCWIWACLHNALDPAEQFVPDFTASNPHKRAYDLAVAALQQAKQAAAVQGTLSWGERRKAS